MSRPPVAAPPSPQPVRSSIAGASVSYATWTVVSRAVGLGRVVVIGAVLGPTYLGNTFLAVNMLPNLAFELLTGSLFAGLLVPPLMRHVDRSDPKGVERLAGGFLGVGVLAFAVIIVLTVVAGPVVLGLLSIGVADPMTADAQRQVGWLLLAMFMPQLLFYGLAGTAGAVMHAHGRFALPAAAPALESIGIITTLAVSAAWFGTGTELREVQTGQVLLLGVGTTASVALHAGAVWWGARRLGVVLLPRAGWRDPDVRAIVRRAVPSLGYAGSNATRMFAAVVVANRVPGGVVALHLALSFEALPIAVGARPVAGSLLPDLARARRDRDGLAFDALFARGLSLVCLLTIPAAVAYLVLATPLARAATFGEMSGPAGTTLAAAALAALALGVIGEGIFVLATNGSYAGHDARTPLVAVAWRSGLALTIMSGAFFFTAGVATLVALGIAFSASNAVGAWILSRRIRGDRAQPVWPSLGRTIAAAIIMVVPAYAGWSAVTHALQGPATDMLAMVVATVVGAVVFVVVLRLLRSPDLAFLLDGVRSRSSSWSPQPRSDP